MFRFLLALTSSLCVAQDFPAIQWIQQVDRSGQTNFGGIATDSLGNVYVAGSTLSPNFPVTPGAAQSRLASGGLYRVDGPGSPYKIVGANTAVSSIAVDPQNPDVIYGISLSTPLKSADGGNTWTQLSLPGQFPQIFAVDPSNGQTVYAALFDTGIAKSIDGGATWSVSSSGLPACRNCNPVSAIGTQAVMVDPYTPQVLFTLVPGGLARSADGGLTWKIIESDDGVNTISFDVANPGTVYFFTFHTGAFKSTDHGATFLPTALPVNSILADPNHPGRLIGTESDGSQSTGIFESLDGGSTWTQRLKLAASNLTPDWTNGLIYATVQLSGVVAIATDLSSFNQVGPSGVGSVAHIAVAGGRLYFGPQGGSDVFVTKFDPSGNIVYSTYFGGSGVDRATAITVDQAGNVYVTGTTGSQDFPTTKGAFAPIASSQGNSFLFRLNPDGSVGYSTYFTTSQTTPLAMAADSVGSVYISGYTSGNLPTTPGAYVTKFCCNQPPGAIVPSFITDGFLAKFDATGQIVFATYLGRGTGGGPLAVAPDGSVYLGVGGGVYQLNATGSALLASQTLQMTPAGMAISSDGSLYLAGNVTDHFAPTAGAFSAGPNQAPALPGGGVSSLTTGILKVDSQLQHVIAATYFGTLYGDAIKALAIDPSGNVLVSGSTSPRGLPTRTPFIEAFGPSSGTGFLSELSADLSTLLFSSFLGDQQYFGVSGIAIGANASIVVAGATGISTATPSGPMNVYVNSISLASAPGLRIDAVLNAASLLGDPISPGETIVIRGAGFSSDARVSIGGSPATILSTDHTHIVAVVPQDLAVAAFVQVRTGSAVSNQVLVPVAPASPGLFSSDGSGSGQGYILNKDGTPNSPANPAAPGDPITIFATGVGPSTPDMPYNVFIDTIFCYGVSSSIGRVAGFPGDVLQLTILVPDPATLANANPAFKGFKLPPLAGVVLKVGTGSSQNGLAISIAQ